MTDPFTNLVCGHVREGLFQLLGGGGELNRLVAEVGVEKGDDGERGAVPSLSCVEHGEGERPARMEESEDGTVGKVGMPKNFRFYDLRHTGNTLAADTGAKLKDLMVRAGQSSERAQLIYQHSTVKHQRRLARGIDAEVRQQMREPGAERRQAEEA